MYIQKVSLRCFEVVESATNPGCSDIYSSSVASNPQRSDKRRLLAQRRDRVVRFRIFSAYVKAGGRGYVISFRFRF